MAHNWTDRDTPEQEHAAKREARIKDMTDLRDAAIVEGHKQAERAERLATALRRMTAIASDAITNHNPHDTYAADVLLSDMADILTEARKANL